MMEKPKGKFRNLRLSGTKNPNPVVSNSPTKKQIKESNLWQAKEISNNVKKAKDKEKVGYICPRKAIGNPQRAKGSL